MDWRAKAALFRVFETVPFGKDLHFWAQKHVTKTWPRPAQDVAALIGVARANIADFQRFSTTAIDRATFFEIGAGRDLIVPVVMRLLGVRTVIATDIDPLARLDLVNASATRAAQQMDLPARTFSSWDELARFGVRYRAPFNAAEARTGPIDAFLSNEVLEHIAPAPLSAIFRNIVPQLAPDGIVLHSIDYSDHYARDCGVSRYNFLQYSDRDWQPFNAGAHFVNRLRHSEYRALMEDAGLSVIDEQTYAEALPEHLAIDARFAQFDSDDLHIMRARLIARKRS